MNKAYIREDMTIFPQLRDICIHQFSPRYYRYSNSWLAFNGMSSLVFESVTSIKHLVLFNNKIVS